MKKYIIILTALFLSILSCTNKKTIDENTIYVNLGAEPKTIDPALNITLQGSTYVTHLFECLTTKYKDIAIQPGAAESWDISEDGLTYIFHLRTNGKWSDGKPLTAKDFEYSWKRVVDPNTASEPSYLFEPILNFSNVNAGYMPVDEFGIKALDDYTLEVKLEYPTAYFLELVNLPVFSPVRKDMVEKNPDNWTRDPKTCIGNGAFMLKERKPDESITVVKNTNYWGADTIVAERIKFVLMDNPNSAVAGVKEGSLHFSDQFPYQDVDTLRAEGLIDTATRIGTQYYALNTTNETLKDKRVRKALSLAIDRNYIVDNIIKSGKPAGALVPWGVTDVEGYFRDNAGEYISTNKADYQKNVEEAKRLMAEAGYTNGEGFPVLEFYLTFSNDIPMFEAVQNMWKENLGIDVKLTQMEFAPFIHAFRTERNYTMAAASWTGSYNDPTTFLGMFVSYSYKNHSLFTNQAFDEAISIASKTTDQNIRMRELHKAEKILIEDEAVIIPIAYFEPAVLKSPKLKDVFYIPFAQYKFSYSYLEK
ncbi:peptide ABC transporter substrate-binding protein [Brachyspira pilosicoli]|uniref:peptide ABC transporter substrate-binding protein n=1 Tax=Brachyspira pilosicoli TaxID=52584 RepID=UPI002590A78B|nr:peptide ABC transporter substrate-binding protein [uncultured Brachyspira sp.]